jgi:hypothetical protein
LKQYILLTIALLVISISAHSRIIYYGESVETLTVGHGGPTIFRFDEEVKTISQASKYLISPADKNNPKYDTLSVTPRFKRGRSKVTFILASGAIVNTEIVTVSKNLPEKIDSFYDFRPKDDLIEREHLGEGKEGISKLQLMKSMIRWENIIGYKVKNITRRINSGIKGIEAKLVTVYSGPRFNGYIFKLTNSSYKRTYFIDLRNLGLGKSNLALLSQVDRNTLHPKKSGKNVTFLRIVSLPTSVYYSVSLPVSVIKESK